MISHPSISILVGKSKSGKTHLLKYLLYELGCKQKIDMIHLFSRSLHSAAEKGQYDFIPEQWQHKDFQLSSLKNITRFQRRMIRDHGKSLNIVVVYDDGITKQNESDEFKKIINSFRHLGISMIVSLQYLMGNVSTNFREQIDNCFIFKANTDNSISGNYDAFFSSLGRSLNEYKKLNTNLEQYQCFFIRPHESEVKKIIAPGEIPDYEFIYKSSVSI